jgi:site-specific recombinase XerD
MRRGLGFQLREAGKALADFVVLMEKRKARYITRELALAWAQQPQKVQPAEWARRLGFVRGFARYRSATDPRTEIPPHGLLPFRAKRARPYIYSDAEIRSLLRAALDMPYRFERGKLRPRIFHCLFGLLSVAGLRIGEARNLELQDVDLKAEVLTVRGTKFGKTRLVPLHASTCRVLADYIARRRRHWAGRTVSSYLFVSSWGNRLDGGEIHRTFYALSRKIGLRGAADSHGPRLHDMRQLCNKHPRSMVPVGAGSRTETARVVHLSWPCSHRRHAMVFGEFSGTDAGGDASGRAELGGSAMKSPISLAVLLERFFTQRLMQQRQASPHTISSYRDTFSQFLKFSEQRLKQAPSRQSFHQIDAPLITAFLDHLEKQRGISSRSRNLRLTALRSFFRFAAFEAPAHSAQIQRVLAIPSKRFTRTLVEFLTRAEVDALLAAPDQNTWLGRRDHAFILLAVQTGLRLSEMTALKREDIILGAGAHVRVIGKGRKERCTPVAKSTLAVLKAWLREPQRGNGQVLFPSIHGQPLSVHGVQYMLNKHRVAASSVCASLKDKRVTVHRLRHTMAMDLLQAGVDRSVIALWLGHERLETTQIYLEATIAIKERALAKTSPVNGKPGRYKPGDRLLEFLASI